MAHLTQESRPQQDAALADDRELVTRCQAGDRDAFNNLMRRHQRRIFNAVLRILGDYSRAEEIAQDTFVRAYQAIKGFRQEAKFSTWIYAIAINLCRNRLRRNACACSRTVSLDEPIACGDGEMQREIPDTTQSPDKALEAKEQMGLIQKAIDELDDDFREVVVLRDIQHLAYDEIAAALGVAEGTVKSRLHRARQVLQERLKDVI